MFELAPEIDAFVRVVERGSFAAVATEKGYTASGVSRMISRLENSLGAKLLFRSTRKLSLTPEGEAFLPHAQRILEAIELAGAELSNSTGSPRGHIRINCGTAFANHKLAPILPEFAKTHPNVSLDVAVTDQRVDPVSSQADVTIRVGDLVDSGLVAIPLGHVARIIAASPDYISMRGMPREASDLLNHNCLLLRGFPNQASWPFVENGKHIKVTVAGTITSDSAETLLCAAVAGTGIIRLGDFLGAEALASCQLCSILTDTHIRSEQPINALVQPGRQSLPRVRALLDFLKSKIETCC
ncbi:LysR family transcriptional regulator [Roseobacter weihaiensis]|uniref:LysR family transcriptional regulator n=1 Tax=Roseobacter weihaiensis TaxID=2763262 RepID=UPI001D0B987C|nr:LysR family transcriptional regulator [Roseobacter sp. H9]